MTEKPAKTRRPAAKATKAAKPTVTAKLRPRAPRDPYAAEKKAYIAEMLEHGFPLDDARMIADKTNYASFRRHSRETTPEPAAMGDFFANLTPPPTRRADRLPSPRPPATEPAKAPAKTPTKATRRLIETPIKAVYDFRYEDLPERVKDLMIPAICYSRSTAATADEVSRKRRLGCSGNRRKPKPS